MGYLANLNSVGTVLNVWYVFEEKLFLMGFLSHSGLIINDLYPCLLSASSKRPSGTRNWGSFKKECVLSQLFYSIRSPSRTSQVPIRSQAICVPWPKSSHLLPHTGQKVFRRNLCSLVFLVKLPNAVELLGTKILCCKFTPLTFLNK